MSSSSNSSPNIRPTRPGKLFRNRSRSSAIGESALAEASIAKDLEQGFGNEGRLDPPIENESDSDLESLRAFTSNPEVSMVGSYRQPSLAAAGTRALRAEFRETGRRPSKSERDQARREERSLLRDNKVIAQKHSRGSLGSRTSRESLTAVSPANSQLIEDLSRNAGAETDPLLGGGQTENLDKKWEEAVLQGRIRTTWQREAKVLARSSAPLILTFILQYSLTVASIFTVGHLGRVELAAVSLASMTANITGYAPYYGLATALDTLCAQAYGSGRKKLVGLQLQRMVLFLWGITIPIGIIWVCADLILLRIVPEKDVAILAGQYLKIVLLGGPAFACFESSKRYLQAQGLFSASLYVLLICAPLNALMNWLFVWVFDWGFVGAPLAVAVTDNLLCICVLVYVWLFVGKDCWPGFTKRAFTNWGPMVRLALPGLVMVEAEIAAFEILTLASSYLEGGTSALAAQSVLATLAAITFQIPYPISIASSTRIANLIGATLSDAAKTATRVVGVVACIVGIFNIVLLWSLRYALPRLFTSDKEVAAMISDVIPIMAAFQLFDSLACNCNGVLRGLGRQEIGGYVQIIAYYVVAMPISMATAFGLHWNLRGLWAGVAIALFLVGFVESIFISKINWEKSVEDARIRNELG